MNILRVVYKDGQKYECSFTNDDFRFLEVNVNKVCTGEGSEEDYLSVKCGCVRLLIAAMREIVRYELIPGTTVNREEEWWNTMKKRGNDKDE